MKYLCLVYEEEAKVDALPDHESSTITDEELDYLEELQRRGHCLASARLQPAETAAMVRVHNGSVFISDAPAVGDKARLGGFHLIDARDLNDASGSPRRCHGHAWDGSRCGRLRRATLTDRLAPGTMR